MFRRFIKLGLSEGVAEQAGVDVIQLQLAIEYKIAAPQFYIHLQ